MAESNMEHEIGSTTSIIYPRHSEALIAERLGEATMQVPCVERLLASPARMRRISKPSNTFDRL
jgi:hypothetical protein